MVTEPTPAGLLELADEADRLAGRITAHNAATGPVSHVDQHVAAAGLAAATGAASVALRRIASEWGAAGPDTDLDAYLAGLTPRQHARTAHWLDWAADTLDAAIQADAQAGAR